VFSEGACWAKPATTKQVNAIKAKSFFMTNELFKM
jgi:hypothetical protein